MTCVAVVQKAGAAMLLDDEALERPGSTGRAQVWRVDGANVTRRMDSIATEEPLEVRVAAGGERQTVAITMRTPGADFELSAGFLYGEGVVSDPHELRRITYCVDPEVDPDQRYNIVNVELRTPALPELGSLERHFFTSSACGVCGKAGLEALHIRGCSIPPSTGWLSPSIVTSLPEKLRSAQSVFQSTGGLHAAALFDASGELIALREDVGRHNAVDKLIGWAFLQGKLPLSEHIVLVSGRSSYEIVQKCLAAGVPVLCAVSAPSSLAVDLARDFGMTLVGFLRGERFNIYSGLERFVDTKP
jgi:FdhD protein